MQRFRKCYLIDIMLIFGRSEMLCYDKGTTVFDLFYSPYCSHSPYKIWNSFSITFCYKYLCAIISSDIYMKITSTISSYSCLRCKSISSKCGQTLSYFHYFLYSAKPRILFADQWVILVCHRLVLIPWLWNGINLPPKRSVLLQPLVCRVSNVPVYISKTGSFWA